MCWRNQMMFASLCISLISGLILQCAHAQNNVGCLFSPTVCDIEEECFDDNAFGRCQFPFSPDVDNYRHLIGSETTQLLEKELARLFAGGYRWRHEYTQCVVQNILYMNRHRISYDPGLCSRVMHSSLPDVPPEILSDIESPEPDELAYIKFKPNREDSGSAMYADEIFNPPVLDEKNIEVKQTKKRSTSPQDSEYASNDWITKAYDEDYGKGNQYPEIADKETLFRKLLEVADDTGKLFKQFQNQADRYPDEELPIVRTELSSDLNQRPVFSEAGTQWIPVDENNDYLSANDIIDAYDKKRVRESNEILDSNEIPLLGRNTYSGVKYLDKNQYNDPKYQDKEQKYSGAKYLGKGTFDDSLLLGPHLLEKETFEDESLLGPHFLERESFDDENLLNKNPFDDKALSEKEPYNEDSSENNMGSLPDDSGYEDVQLDDEDSNFRWNYKHINKGVDGVDGIDDDLTRFARRHKDGRRKNIQPSDKNLNDIIEDDYLEDQLYAILPVDNGMSTFTRDMREDTKKPGPTYMIHEDEDGDTSHDDADMAAEGARALISRLSNTARDDQLLSLLKPPVVAQKSSTVVVPSRESIVDGTRALISRLSKTAREAQLLSLLKPPVVAQKSSTVVVPSREVIEAAQRIVVRGEVHIPSSAGRDKFERDKPSEPLPADQPEVIEGIANLLSKDAKEEDRMANVAQTGEGHIGHFDTVDATHAYLRIKEKDQNEESAKKLVETLGSMLNLPKGSFSDIRIEKNQITFKVNPNTQNLNASDVAAKAEEQYIRLKELTGITVEAAGIGDKVKYEVVNPNKDKHLFILAFALCGGVAGILLSVAAAYLFRRHTRSREKLQNVAQADTEPSQDYQDLCRQRMASKSNDKPENIHSTVHSPKRIRSLSQEGQASSSSHSSTSSWNEEPVTSNMDISTGHIILAYMEDHLKNKDRLDREWEGLCAYEAELCSTATASLPQNIKKNRYTDVLPYDHSRVVLTEVSNVASSDYINASSITDHDPRNPAYIATQGPLPQTAADFWQMIWEQGSVVIVMLSRLMENGVAMCHRYWPEEGSEVYHIYEVHLVSEHIWCDDYLVRSFYLKNLRTNETRTVTQFHFMSWPDNGVPNSTKALLEFRRKVNKSYRGRSCPIVVHCSDGIGRTGTYCLIDMVLNRMAKGAKEIDIAATLEHVRDQRAGMVKTKAQFEFVLMAIAEEVHAILKALSQ